MTTVRASVLMLPSEALLKRRSMTVLNHASAESCECNISRGSVFRAGWRKINGFADFDWGNVWFTPKVDLG